MNRRFTETFPDFLYTLNSLSHKSQPLSPKSIGNKKTDANISNNRDSFTSVRAVFNLPDASSFGRKIKKPERLQYI